MEKRPLQYLAVLIMLTLVLPVILLDADAVSVTKITPVKPKVGHTAVVHGDGFRDCGSFLVMFGSASGEVPAPGNVRSDKVVKFKVPVTEAGVYDVSVDCDGEITPVGPVIVRE